MNSKMIEVIITLINKMVRPRHPLRSLDELKDGKHLCFLIIENEWNKVFTYLSNTYTHMDQICIADIDMDLLHDLLPHKIFAIIEEFIRKHYGFDYVISDGFRSGHLLSVYQISILILSVLSKSNSQLIKQFHIEMKSQFCSVIEESYSLIKRMKEKFDPFSDQFQEIKDALNESINSSIVCSKQTEYNGHKSKSLRIYEMQQIFKLIDNTHKMNSRKTSIREMERSDDKLHTTIALIVSYNYLFALNHNLSRKLKIPH